jgi:electron transport complex protein RnfC
MKKSSNAAPIEAIEVQAGMNFFIPLTQHTGIPARPVVKKGQIVRTGELIAEAAGFISANIHSPVNGVINAADVFADYPMNTRAQAISLTASDNQNTDFVPLKEDLLVNTVKAAGIVGMGGAMFPSHIKLSPQKKPDILIVNGAECEPYLTCDHRLMLERTPELIRGALTIKESLKLKRVIMGTEANKADAVNALRTTGQNRIEVISLPVKYPQGGERQLIKSITGKEVPEGKLPVDVGVIVHNVSTVLAVHDAVYMHKPLTHRVVTVTGGVKKPKNILAPIGMPISCLIDACGGPDGDIEKVVLGGPMTGICAHSLNIPVYKGLNGIVVYLKDAVKRKTPSPRPCIRCARCVRACPAGLSPVTLENFAAKEMYKELAVWKLMDCIECGACNYVCPSFRHLKNIFRLSKKKIAVTAAEGKNGG